MKPVSLSAAWLETVAFIRRESGLLFPVILLFVAIPLAAIFSMVPDELRQMTPGAPPPNAHLPPAAIVVIPAASLLILGGVLSCYALAMKAGVSLREALQLGFRNIPYALAAAFLVGVALALPMVALSAFAPLAANVYVTAATLFFSVKFLFLNAVIVGEGAGPVAAIRRSWALARGNAGRLLLLVIAITIPIMLAQAVAGILFGLLGYAIGGPDAAHEISDLAGSVVLAIGQLFMIVLTTRLYRQLA